MTKYLRIEPTTEAAEAMNHLYDQICEAGLGNIYTDSTFLTIGRTLADWKESQSD